ncbi:tetratricopeptide repeat protein [Derxia gummosa]|uniref:Tetratricopeptide repeat protein n=1 Tax=Derxia gummosa DSM 723 TaxID=1121388 RepID=A0A8B6XBE3_9BURK|nr:hypothetical protein [Derxia gummosa]
MSTQEGAALAGFDPASGFDADFDFDLAVLGGGLPPDVQNLIEEGGRLWQQPEQAHALLIKARELAPEHPATLIALYRFYFYSHRLAECREIAKIALATSRYAVQSNYDPVADARDNVPARFYLFCLKGFAYLNLRLGEFDAARVALDELRLLDPKDVVGGSLLAIVLNRYESGEDEYDDDVAPPSPSRKPYGWAQVEPTP